MKLLDRKVVVITGGAGLLGREFVKAVANNGATVVIADINDNSIKESIESIKKDISNVGQLDSKLLDITSVESINSLLSYVYDKYGKIDAIVNNAYPRNKNYGRKIENVTYNDFCENLNINLGGYFLVSQRSAEFFKKQGFGNIVNISSIYGVIAPRFEVYDGTEMTMPVEYAAIKSALIHLTKYMAKYFKGSNIRFNCISPGGILDKQPETFLNRYKQYSLNKGMLDKTDISGTLVYLLSDMSTFVNGQNIVVDDGWSL